MFLLKFYFSKLPPEAVSDSTSLFYLQPKMGVSVDSPWFKCQVRGRNTLGGLVKSKCEKVGIMGKTNHSLRATGATRLFESKVPDIIIQQRTGHASLDSLLDMKGHQLSNKEQFQG